MVTRQWTSRLQQIAFGLSLGILLTILVSGASAADTELQRVQVDFSARFQTAERLQQPFLEGVKPWLYLSADLRALTVGPFWDASAAQASRSTNPLYADPTPAILDFHLQLKEAGIELLIVPVPAKAATYPEYIFTDSTTEAAKLRIDITQEEFYQRLKKQGVRVVDLQPLYLKQKVASPKRHLFCKTDSHWSGAGIEIAADAIHQEVQQQAWYQAILTKDKLNPKAFQTRSVERQIAGDLASLRSEKQPESEVIDLTNIMFDDGNTTEPLATSEQSPVLLLGDSHTLIFHDPQLFGTGAGLVDQLAQRLLLKLDLIGVRGSGANAARITWRRRADPLKGKKLVIWCFSVREFTENIDGWKKIPVKKAS